MLHRACHNSHNCCNYICLRVHDFNILLCDEISILNDVTQVESFARVLHQLADNWLETFKENYRVTKQQLFLGYILIHTN